MIWAIVLLGVLLVVGSAVGAATSPAKTFVAFIGTGVIVFVLFLTLAITNSAGGPAPIGGISHAQLEADRIMTEQMRTVVGSGMQSLMATNGMLERSASDTYLRALEQHVYQADRMLGRVP